MKSTALSSLALLSTLAFMAGCHKQIAAVKPPAPPPPTAVAQAAPPPAPRAAEVVEQRSTAVATMPDQHTKDQIQALLNRMQDVYFAYDKHNLTPEAQAGLQADAKTLREILQQYPTYKLTVEGFCDERGSDEYNMALGDMRAKKAEQFLVDLGLPSSQLRTVSFGKEDPVCTEHSEACWQKNRRAHITQDQNAG
jgi:peptidoglycan-associated lipoprotein